MQVLVAANTCILNLLFLRTAPGGENLRQSRYLDNNKLIQKVSGKSFVIDYTIKSATNKKKMDGT